MFFTHRYISILESNFHGKCEHEETTAQTALFFIFSINLLLRYFLNLTSLSWLALIINNFSLHTSLKRFSQKFHLFLLIALDVKYSRRWKVKLLVACDFPCCHVQNISSRREPLFHLIIRVCLKQSVRMVMEGGVAWKCWMEKVCSCQLDLEQSRIVTVA